MLRPACRRKGRAFRYENAGDYIAHCSRSDLDYAFENLIIGVSAAPPLDVHPSAATHYTLGRLR
jgi:hypothetical protein